MAKIKHLKVQITEDLHFKFKVYCAKNKVNMNEYLAKAIEKIVKKET